MVKRILKIGGLCICVIFCGTIWYFCSHYSIADMKEMFYIAAYNGEAEIRVDFNETVNTIKPLNGINNGPKSRNYGDISEDKWELDATEIYKELNIPVVRTHDSEYPYGQDKFIDIHCIFPDFSKDVDDPSSYNFVYTDKYIEAIVESGAEVLFRLGESIDHSGNNLYINPPEDYKKWAQICEHIIRHYNEGWADGYKYNIQYWEIWNEPDNTGKMWTGTMEEFYELYKVTATYLKSVYPDIYIGGYGAANCSEDNITQFLQYIKQDGEQTPLDFFSWHTYTSEPWEYGANAATVRRLLDENGYTETLSFLDEWNYIESWSDILGAQGTIQTVKGASFIISSLIMMQYSPIDKAMYYDGQFTDGIMAWCGLYKSEEELLPGYYAFELFEKIYQQGEQVSVSEPDDGMDSVYYLAASGEKDSVLLTNYDGKKSVEVAVKYDGDKKKAAITRINEELPEGVTAEKKVFFNTIILNVKPNEIIYVELS